MFMGAKHFWGDLSQAMKIIHCKCCRGADSPRGGAYSLILVASEYKCNCHKNFPLYGSCYPGEIPVFFSLLLPAVSAPASSSEQCGVSGSFGPPAGVGSVLPGWHSHSGSEAGQQPSRSWALGVLATWLGIAWGGPWGCPSAVAAAVAVDAGWPRLAEEDRVDGA